METAGRWPAVRICRLACRLGAGLALQPLLEPLDLAGRVDDRLLAREERVAIGADVDAQLLAGGPDGPFGAARAAVGSRLVILGMDVRLHGNGSPPTSSVRGTCPPVIAGCGAWLRVSPWRPRRALRRRRGHASCPCARSRT